MGLAVRDYIFFTNEGEAKEPNGSDIENSQIVGLAKGKNIKDAFENLKNENPYLMDTSFDEVVGMELADEKRSYFSLKE